MWVYLCQAQQAHRHSYNSGNRDVRVQSSACASAWTCSFDRYSHFFITRSNGVILAFLLSPTLYGTLLLLIGECAELLICTTFDGGVSVGGAICFVGEEETLAAVLGGTGVLERAP